MTKDRWLDVKASIVEKFEVTRNEREALIDRPGTADILEFTTPAGKFRLEFVEAARATGIATSGGKRVGTAGHVTHTYSHDEQITRLDAYRWDGTTWQAMDAEAFL